MSIIDIFRKKQPPKEVVVLDPIVDEEAVAKKQAQREKSQLVREQMRIELEKLRLESQREKMRIEEDLEDAREERYIRRLERQARRAELEAELYGDDEEDVKEATPEAMLFSFLKDLKKKDQGGMHYEGISIHNPTPALVDMSPPLQQVQSVSRADIDKIWANLSPEYKAIAKTMTDEDLRRYIIGDLPNIDQDSLNYAIMLARSN